MVMGLTPSPSWDLDHWTWKGTTVTHQRPRVHHGQRRKVKAVQKQPV